MALELVVLFGKKNLDMQKLEILLVKLLKHDIVIENYFCLPFVHVTFNILN